MRIPGRLRSPHPMVFAVFCVCLVGAVLHESFLTPDNLVNVARQNSMIGLMTLGMMLAMLSGGIDLSLGAMLAAGGIVAAALSGHGVVVAVVGAVAFTGFLGACNGLLVAGAGIQPFIATLAMNMALRGMLLYVTAEESVRVARSAVAFKWLGRGWLGPLPVPALVLAGTAALLAFVLARTRFGQWIYAAGDSDEAARLMGVNVGAVWVGVYALGAALTGLGGALLAARLGIAQPTAALGWELTAITAVIVGGTGSAGGRAGAFSSLGGLLLLALVFNLLSLETPLNSYWQWVLRGGFLLLIVVAQQLLRDRARATPAGRAAAAPGGTAFALSKSVSPSPPKDRGEP